MTELTTEVAYDNITPIPKKESDRLVRLFVPVFDQMKVIHTDLVRQEIRANLLGNH